MDHFWPLAAAVGGAFVSAGTILGFLGWLSAPRVIAWLRRELLDPVQETHTATTVNGHSSGTPTLRDEMSDIKSDVRHVDAKVDSLSTKIDDQATTLTDHLVIANRDAARLERVDRRLIAVERMDVRLANLERMTATRAEAEAAMWPAIEAVAKSQPPEDT